MSDTTEIAAALGYRKGPEMIALDPFTDKERWVLLDSQKAKEWLAAQKPPAVRLVVTHVDPVNRTVTLNTTLTKDGPR